MLWGLREGLRLLAGMDVRRVLVELDSEAVVNIMKGGLEFNDNHSTLVNDCIQLAKRIRIDKFLHVLREGNKCADWLANIGQMGSWGTTHLDSSPEGLYSLLEADARGVRFQRIK